MLAYCAFKNTYFKRKKYINMIAFYWLNMKEKEQKYLKAEA